MTGGWFASRYKCGFTSDGRHQVAEDDGEHGGTGDLKLSLGASSAWHSAGKLLFSGEQHDDVGSSR
jgi:hypothetical protein